MNTLFSFGSFISSLLQYLLVVAVILMPIVTVTLLWKMISRLKMLEKAILSVDYADDARISFLKGNTTVAQQLLDDAYFKELLNAKRADQKKAPYETVHRVLSRKYDKLYYRMNLVSPDFELYRDPINIP